MATIKDVAKKAGVSISTVSLMLNGKRNISAEKYNLILAAMQELNYRPNRIAQNLKKHKADLIGLVFPHNEGHYAQIIRGIHDVLDARGHHVILSLTDNDIYKEETAFEHLLSLGVAGIIAVPSDTNDIEKYRAWQNTPTPIVFVERKIEQTDFSNVFFDDRELVFETTRELLERFAPEELALITGPLAYFGEQEAKTGFLQALESRGQTGSNLFTAAANVGRAAHELLDQLQGSFGTIRCYLTTSPQTAEVVAELCSAMQQHPEIYALSGDVWSRSGREEPHIRLLPREAGKLGTAAAELLLDQLHHGQTAEKRDIPIVSGGRKPASRPCEVQVTQGQRIRVCALRANAMDVLYKLSESFTRQTGIGVDFTFVPFDKLTAALLKEDAPALGDVLWVDLPLIDRLAREGKLLPLTPYLAKDPDALSAIPQPVLDCTKSSDGQRYGMPILMEQALLYYRKDVFSNRSVQWNFYNRYGFELKPPVTWTEYNTIAEFFRGYDDGVFAFPYGNVLALTAPTAMLEEFYVRQRAFNGRMVDQWGNPCIHSVENVRALENLMQSYRFAPEASLSYFYEESFELLLKGDTPMILGFPTHCLPYRLSRPERNYQNQIEAVLPPGKRSILGGWVFSISAAAKQPEAAYRFLRWAAGEEEAVIRGLLGHLTPCTATFESALLNRYYPGLSLMNAARYSAGLRQVIRRGDQTEVDHARLEAIMASAITAALKGELAPGEALAQAHQQVVSLLGEGI